MIKAKVSIKVSIWVCIALAVVLAVWVCFAIPVFDLYMTAYRGFAPGGQALAMIKRVFLSCFYPCAALSSIILYVLLKLLFNLKNERVFIFKNITYLKIISYCLLLVGIITFAGGFFYMPCMFVAAAGLFTGMLLRVVKNVFQSAVELREENDLTI